MTAYHFSFLKYFLWASLTYLLLDQCLRYSAILSPQVILPNLIVLNKCDFSPDFSPELKNHIFNCLLLSNIHIENSTLVFIAFKAPPASILLLKATTQKLFLISLSFTYHTYPSPSCVESTFKISPKSVHCLHFHYYYR